MLNTSPPSLLRPFYFFVVVWGERFRHYLTHYCLPSLLAPDNLPALHNRQQNKLLICTTVADWHALKSTLIFKKLSDYVTPIFIEIPLPAAGVSSCQHMGIGHQLATELCFRDKAYGLALTPDLLLANGTLANVQNRAQMGYTVILCAALRFAEEKFFHQLHPLCSRSFQEDSAEPLTLSSRQLVQLSLHSFHSETETYDFESPYFAVKTPIALWRLPDQKGMIIHSLSWCPLLIDYSAIVKHSTLALETWTMDGDYIHSNFDYSERIYVCTDSDEMMLLSWAPLAYQAVPVKAGNLRRWWPSLCPIINRYFLQETLIYPIFDPLKLCLFPKAVRWHIDDLDDSWQFIEKKIQRALCTQRTWHDALFHFGFVCTHVFKKTIRGAIILFTACFGNPSARQKIKRRVKLLLST